MSQKSLPSVKHEEEVIGKVPELDLNIEGFKVIEQGVRDLVIVLWERGYRTVCSCAGHTKAFEAAPWVTILIDEADHQLLFKLFLAVGRFNLNKGEDGKLPRSIDTWVLSPQQVDEKFAVYLRPQVLNERRSYKEIKRLQRLGAELASFIENQCSDIFSPC